jgi:hypothetical protein
MKLVVLVPSQESLATAGVRIRYLRLREPLAEAGVSLAVTPIDRFDPVTADCGVVIVSKCYDARALVAAVVAARRKISVGVDLFDDYFSDERDSRLSRYRTWLRQMLRISDFAICSTPSMAQIIGRYRADIPVHILNDPAPAIDRSELAHVLQRKISGSSSSAVLRLSWFGIGDNPFFPVGISDLAAFGGALRGLASDGIPIELTILTNKRALDQSGLAMIAQLPFPAKIDLWSSQREAQLLMHSDVCFLPVNAQPFSVSKSMNRALTALSAGCQVLSVGYPLYEALDELIYRDPASLLADWRRGEPRLRASSVPILEAKIEQLASSRREAAELATFLEARSRTRSSGVSTGPIALLHGFTTTQAAHAAVKAAGGLSIATPFCSQELDFDAIVRLPVGGEPSLLVSTDALRRVRGLARRPKGAQRLAGRKFVAVGPSAVNDEEPATERSLPLQIALYEPLIERLSALLSDSFGIATVLLSEESALPVEPAI